MKYLMALVNKSVSDSPRIQMKAVDWLLVRINGTLPNVPTIGEEKNSERAAEINQKEIKANTSCSVFSTFSTPASASQPEIIFHLLVDIGEGVVGSLEKLAHGSGPNPIQELPLSKIPNAVLITHSHDDHVSDLPKLADKAKEFSCTITIYCTKECLEQITKKFPTLMETNYLNFTPIRTNEDVKIGPLNVIPVLANHGENTHPGSLSMS